MLLTAGKFLQALKDFGDVDEETISEAHLRTEYGSVQTQVLSQLVTSIAVVYVYTYIPCLKVQESLDKQPQLVQRIMTASAEFENLTAGQSVGEREAKLKELATGYDAFHQLVSNISEGTKVSQSSPTAHVMIDSITCSSTMT